MKSFRPTCYRYKTLTEREEDEAAATLTATKVPAGTEDVKEI